MDRPGAFASLGLIGPSKLEGLTGSMLALRKKSRAAGSVCTTAHFKRLSLTASSESWHNCHLAATAVVLSMVVCFSVSGSVGSCTNCGVIDRGSVGPLHRDKPPTRQPQLPPPPSSTWCHPAKINRFFSEVWLTVRWDAVACSGLVIWFVDSFVVFDIVVGICWRLGLCLPRNGGGIYSSEWWPSRRGTGMSSWLYARRRWEIHGREHPLDGKA